MTACLAAPKVIALRPVFSSHSAGVNPTVAGWAKGGQASKLEA